tara:strand:+ start:134 stop:256 length:123 start_codon:yes stop_codon:yes gene_type:complete
MGLAMSAFSCKADENQCLPGLLFLANKRHCAITGLVIIIE